LFELGFHSKYVCENAFVMVYGLFVGMKLKLSSWLFIHGMYDEEYVVIDGMQVEFSVKLVIWDMYSSSVGVKPA